MKKVREEIFLQYKFTRRFFLLLLFCKTGIGEGRKKGKGDFRGW
jgi:hypothetical protein